MSQIVWTLLFVLIAAAVTAEANPISVSFSGTIADPSDAPLPNPQFLLGDPFSVHFVLDVTSGAFPGQVTGVIPQSGPVTLVLSGNTAIVQPGSFSFGFDETAQMLHFYGSPNVSFANPGISPATGVDIFFYFSPGTFSAAQFTLPDLSAASSAYLNWPGLYGGTGGPVNVRSVTISPVPEPSSVGLFGTGILLLVALRGRYRSMSL